MCFSNSTKSPPNPRANHRDSTACSILWFRIKSRPAILSIQARKLNQLVQYKLINVVRQRRKCFAECDADLNAVSSVSLYKRNYVQ